MRFLYFLIAEAGGFCLIRYNKWVIDHTMRFEFFEKNLGYGSSYSVIQFGGVAVMAIGFYILFGGFNL